MTVAIPAIVLLVVVAFVYVTANRRKKLDVDIVGPNPVSGSGLGGVWHVSSKEGGEEFCWVIDWGDGTKNSGDSEGGAASQEHTYADEGVYGITLLAVTDEGREGMASDMFRASRRPPTE